MAKILRKNKLGQGHFTYVENIKVDTDFFEVEWFTFFPRKKRLVAQINYYQSKASINTNAGHTFSRIFEFVKADDVGIESFIENELLNTNTLKETNENIIQNFHKGAAEEPPIAPPPIAPGKQK